MKAMPAALSESASVPDTLEELLRIPGLGPYGARAVLSFGFGTPAAVVDSNVIRILKR
ncbi:MAG: A/G-specific adenine glycosylase, partial [Gemmatimonadales bacterium]|nr:A/G-specific adenine glycosylase [Gemmatimonadales bacterium]